jgi:hypothetical protein
MTDATMYITINAGDVINYFWAGKVNKVVVAETFKAKMIGWDEKTGVAKFEWDGSPNGRAWGTVRP